MRIAFTLLLIFTAAPACAEWVKVGRTDTAVHYVDPATVRKEGNLRTVWALQDTVQSGEDGIRSIRSLQEYDCALERFRFVSVEAHSEPMAGGWILAEHHLRDAWSNRPPGTRAATIGKIVCAR
jgi:hypothetical protein